jgi:putative ABC transport system permease protein
VESVAGSSFGLLNSVVVPSINVDVTATSSPRAGSGGAALAIGIGRESTHLIDRRSLSAAYFLVTPGFFTAIKATLVDGRDLAATDISSSPWVAIINESAANRFWPGQSPVGRRFTVPGSPDDHPREVIGIVRDIPLTVEGQVTPVVYTSYLQQPLRHPQPVTMFGQMSFMVRATGDPISLLPAVRRIVADVDPDRPLANVATMERRLASVVPQRGYFVFAITAFALTATLLAAIGIYGVLAYSVSQRVREIGIRLALGAGVLEVVMLVGRRALNILSLGVGVGIVTSLMLTRLLQSQLWNVEPHDPMTFATMTVLLVIVAVAAAVIPIRRAAGVNPTVALRCE